MLVIPALCFSRGSVGCTGPWFSSPDGDSTPGHWGESVIIRLVGDSTPGCQHESGPGSACH